MSAILRHRHPNQFTVLPNNAIRNPALSFRAVGVLAHLLSLPDGAKVDSASLATAHKEGRDAVRSAFSELAAHGYYRRDVVRLPDGTLRTEVVVSSIPMDPAEAEEAGRTGAGFSGVGPEPGNPASADPAPVDPTSVGPTPVGQATTEVPTTQNHIPPQPPRPAGGPEVDPATPTASGRRGAGTNPRSQRTNPRAEADLAEAARLEAEAAARRAELERVTQARRVADHTAQLESDRLEAEALAVSGALPDPVLARIVAVVTPGMPGPLARSSMAISRAVVAWCRTAAERHPGPFADAVSVGLAEAMTVGEGSATAPLTLPPAAVETPSLRHRIAALLDANGGG